MLSLKGVMCPALCCLLRTYVHSSYFQGIVLSILQDDPEIMEIDPPEVTARRAVTRARTAFLHQVPVKPEPVEPHGVLEWSTDEPEQSRAIGDSEDDGRMVRHSRYIVFITSNGFTALSAADSGRYSCPP